jgi:hypothetical protein
MNFWWLLSENQQSSQSIGCVACQFCIKLSLFQNQAHPNEKNHDKKLPWIA